MPVERIAEGDVVDLKGLVEDQVLAVGARERELVAVDRLRVDASLVGRIERDVDPRPALERSGRRRGDAGRLRVDLLLLHRVAGDVLPAPRDEGQRHGRVAELAAEEIAVGVREVAAGVAQPDRRGVELDVVIGAAGDRELRAGVQDRLRIRGERRRPGGRLQRVERHIDVPATVEVLAIDHHSRGGVRQFRRRQLHDEVLGLRLVRDAAGVGERPGTERHGVLAGLEGAGEGVAIVVGGPHAHGRGPERDQMPGAVAQLELVAVDRRGVEMVAAARLERHFQVAEPVDGLLADRPAVQARDHLGLGAGGIAVGIQDRHHGPLDEVAARALHREGLRERAILDSARVGPLVGREVDRHLARDEVTREQVAERSVADAQRCAGRESDARTAEAGECELTAVDRRRDERAARARGEGDVDERPVVGGAQIAEVAGLAGLRAARGGARVGPGVREEVGSQRHRPTGIVGQRHDDREVEGVGGPDLNRGAAGIELDRPVAVRDHDVELRAGIGHRCGIELESGEEAGRDIRNRHAQHARQVRAEAEGLVEVGIRVRIVDALFGRRGRIGVLVRDHDRRSGTAGTFRALVPALIDELVLDDDSRERRRTRIHVDLVAIDRVRHLGRRHVVVEGHRPVGSTQRHRHEDLVDHDFLGSGAGVSDRALDDFLAVVGDREDNREELLGIAEREDVLGGRRHPVLRCCRPQNERAAVHLGDHEGVVLGRRHEAGRGTIDGRCEPPSDVVGFVVRRCDRVVVGRPGDGHRPRLAVGDAAAHHDGFGRGRDVGDVRRSAVRGGCRQVEPAAAGLGDDQRGVLGAGGEPDNRVDLCSEF